MNKLSKTLPALALMIAAYSSANAQMAVKNSNNGNAAVSYLTSNDNDWVFKVEFYNAGMAKTEIRINDEQGRELYSERSGDKHFNKVFRLNRENGNKFTFIISNGKQQLQRSFEVVTRYQEEVIETSGSL
jgi:hypothetical protein